jgi:hypothetical protein
VVINSSGQLGTVTSSPSARFEQNIPPLAQLRSESARVSRQQREIGRQQREIDQLTAQLGALRALLQHH